MLSTTQLDPVTAPQAGCGLAASIASEEELSTWTGRAQLLWQRRRTLIRLSILGFVLGLAAALLIPRRYTSVATIMPPDQSSSNAVMLAALAGHTTGLSALSSMASGLVGLHSSSAVFAALLHSGTVADALIQRFDLMHVYHCRYHRDAARRLARNTSIIEDKKSGMLALSVQDGDPIRARDLAQGYLDELNKLVARSSTSHARQERVFLESRLNVVGRDLEEAQIALSTFSSQNSTIDIKEQTRAIVDTGARLQAQLLVEQSGLQSLRQIYGDDNIRVRQSAARIGTLEHQLHALAGSSDPADNSRQIADPTALSPSLRQLPGLAARLADLYRRVRVQETVFELLTEQCEMARIAEVRDIPVVSVIDVPGIPEKKSFPPRALITLCTGILFTFTGAAAIVVQERWRRMPADEPRKRLVCTMLQSHAFSWLHSTANV